MDPTEPASVRHLALDPSLRVAVETYLFLHSLLAWVWLAPIAAALFWWRLSRCLRPPPPPMRRDANPAPHLEFEFPTTQEIPTLLSGSTGASAGVLPRLDWRASIPI